MKKRFLKIVSAGVIFSVTAFTNIANAGLINSDFNTGDGMTVTDDVSNLVWLDLTMTQGLTVTSALASYSDFRLATYDEVSQMVDSYFGTSYEWENNSDQSGAALAGAGRTLASEFISLFGETYLRDSSALTNETIGYFQSNTPGQYHSMNIAYSTHSAFLSGFNYVNRGITNRNIEDAQYGSAGFYLVQKTTDVPEPSTLAIFALSMIGLASRRLKKRS